MILVVSVLVKEVVTVVELNESGMEKVMAIACEGHQALNFVTIIGKKNGTISIGNMRVGVVFSLFSFYLALSFKISSYMA